MLLSGGWGALEDGILKISDWVCFLNNDLEDYLSFKLVILENSSNAILWLVLFLSIKAFTNFVGTNSSNFKYSG